MWIPRNEDTIKSTSHNEFGNNLDLLVGTFAHTLYMHEFINIIRTLRDQLTILLLKTT